MCALTVYNRAEAAKWVLFANSTLPDAAFAAHMRWATYLASSDSIPPADCPTLN